MEIENRVKFLCSLEEKSKYSGEINRGNARVEVTNVGSEHTRLEFTDDKGEKKALVIQTRILLVAVKNINLIQSC